MRIATTLTATLIAPMLALPAFADRPPPADAKPLSAILAQLETSIGADLAYIDDVDWDDDGYYEVEYRLRDGSTVKTRLDPLSGDARR
ncbi:MAG: PepSY domain-containing protein [Paracoccus sp. (in: a-proteobacteria)]|nr:PepSY domain-containing protein [Paracoccus sp. (in: a-proteobacteria)]